MTDLINIRALEAIEALQRPGKPNLLDMVVGLFETDAPKNIESLLGALEVSDLELVRTSAHTLKSSSAYLGAAKLSELCRDIEHAARDDDESTCASLSVDLPTLYENSLAELHLRRQKAA